MLGRRSSLILAFILLAASRPGALEYHDYFIGFGTEVGITAGPVAAPRIPGELAVGHISFMGTYGPAAIRPVRLRAGAGWYPRRPFRLTAGVEIPVFERLNRGRARMFGIYLLSDLALTIPWGWEADAVLTILVPTSAVGGIRFGAGVNRHLQLLANVGFASGVYPIRTRR